MGLMGLIFGALLAVASKKFAVASDERVGKVRAVLPGVNCGACGYAGCDALAEAIVAGKAALDACKAGGPRVAEKVADIMGAKLDKHPERMVALVKCVGNKDKTKYRGEYSGVPSCRAAVMAGNGPKDCLYGCLGFGDCVRACPFDAIHISPGGVAVVDADKCTACGKCVAACPRGIIELVPASHKVHVLCMNQEKGVVTRKQCTVGCIACQACVRACPKGAISVQNNVAKIDYSKCDDCALCAAKCPVKVISGRKESVEAAAS
ncbi:MAG TPA: RnfABCDGE type electron transport complex subunit B [Firmicutes bacterium]|nr:RnfABCDGE type electron transport complex subunit B [Bacillota bacterium]